MLLRLPNHSQKHQQRNVLPPYWHVHQGSNRGIAPAPCHQNSTTGSTQSQLGSQISNGATPPMPVLPNEWLHSHLSKAFSSWALSAAQEAQAHAWPRFSNERISRDKGLHCNFACLLYSKLINHLPKEHAIDIFSSVTNIEMEFIVNSLPVELIGMNLTMMYNGIKFCANRLLIAISCRRHYKIGSPLELMEMISLQEGKQFFEKCVGEYSKSRVEVGRADHTFALDASFWPPHLTLILHLASVYMLHTTLFPVGTPIAPPHLHTFCFRGFMESNSHRCDGCSLKSNEFFGRRDSHPSLPKYNKPQW